MSLLLAAVWPWLAAGLALGLAVGALAGLPRGRTALGLAAVPLAGLLALAALALLQAAPGRAGLWVETGALLLAAYLAGCGLGGLGRRLAGRSS